MSQFSNYPSRIDRFGKTIQIERFNPVKSSIQSQSNRDRHRRFLSFIPQDRQRFLIFGDCQNVLEETKTLLQKAFPEADILTVENYTISIELLKVKPDLVVVMLNTTASINNRAFHNSDLKLIEQILSLRSCEGYFPNLAIFSDRPQPLIRLKKAIKNYPKGLAIIKNSIELDSIYYLKLAMQGLISFPPAIEVLPKLEPALLELLNLRFNRAFNDKAIARKMGVSDRTIRNYWIRIRDALGITDDPDKDTKVAIAIVARKFGLIR